MIVHRTTSAACWITEHLQVDARKYAHASLEIAGLLIETRHHAERRDYAWFLNGRKSTRIAVETAIDRQIG